MKRVLLLSSVLALSASVALAQDEYGFPEGFTTDTSLGTVKVERSVDEDTGYPTLNITGSASLSESDFYLWIYAPYGYDGVIGGQVKPTGMTRSEWVPVADYIKDMNAMFVPNVEDKPNGYGISIPTGEPFYGYYCCYKDDQVDINTMFQVVANVEKVRPSLDVNFSNIPVQPEYPNKGDVYWDGDVLNVQITTPNSVATVRFDLPTYYTGLVGNLAPISTGTRSEEGWEPLDKWTADGFIPGFEDQLWNQGLQGVFRSWGGYMNIQADGQTYEGTVYLSAGDEVNVTRSFKVIAKAEKVLPEFTGDFSEINARINWGASDGSVYWEGDNLIVRAQAQPWASDIEISMDLPEGFSGLIGNIEAATFGTRSADDWYPMNGHDEWNNEKEEWEWIPGAYDELSQQPGFFNSSNWFNVPADGKTYEGKVYLVAGENVYAARPFNVIVTAFQPATAPEFPTSFDVTVNPSEINHYQTSLSNLSGEYYETFVENAGSLLNNCETAIVLNSMTIAENVDLSINVPEGWSGIIAYKYDPSKIVSDEGRKKVNGFEPGYPEEMWMPSWMVPMEEGSDFTFPVGEPQIYLCYLTTDAVRDYYIEGHLYDSANSFLIYVDVDVDIIGRNQIAYEEVMAKISTVQKEYYVALDEAQNANPSFDFGEWKDMIDKALDDAANGAKQALEAANEDGEAFQFAFDGEDIIAMIAEMKKAPLVAENEAAYNDVIAQLNELQARYESAVEEIKETNPDFNFEPWEEIGTMIESYKGWALQALNSANEDGESFFFPVGTEDITAYIDMMIKTANAPKFPTSFDVTFNGQTSFDLIEATQGEDEYGVYTIKVSGMSLEDKVTVALAVPAGWDGFVCMNEDDFSSEINPLTRAYESEWVPVDMLLEYGFKEGNKLTFAVDGENHLGSLYLVKDGEADEANQIQIEFNVSNPTSGVAGVETIDDNANYYDFNGHQIAKPAAGMYIKVLNGKPSKVIIK